MDFFVVFGSFLQLTIFVVSLLIPNKYYLVYFILYL